MDLRDCLSGAVTASDRILMSFPVVIDLKRLSYSDLQDIAIKLAQEIVVDDELKAVRMRELMKPNRAKFVLPFLPLTEDSESIAKRISARDWPDVLPYVPISAESSQILKKFDIHDWNTFLELNLWSLLTKSAISVNSVVDLIGEILLSIFVEARDDRSLENEKPVTQESIVATQNGGIDDDENAFLGKLALNLVQYENSVAETVSYSVPSSLNVSPSRVLFDRALTRLVDYFFVSGVQDIDEVFKAIADENNESLEVQHFRNTCKALRTDDLTQLTGDISAAVESAYDRILDGLEPKKVAIVTERILGGNQSTLEQLGERFEITRERIRQIETQLEPEITKIILKTDEPVILWIVAALRSELGNCFKLDCPETQLILDRYLERIDSSKRKAICTMLLEILARYTYENGWYRQTNQVEINPTSSEFFEPLFKDTDFVRWDDAVDFVQGLNVDDKFVKYIFEEVDSYKRLDDWFAVWGGNIGDKCEVVLKIIGGPRTVEEMLEFAEEPHSAGTTGNRLAEDPRFKRTAKGQWDLSTSDRPEYTSVVGLIEKKLNKCGGIVPLKDMISELVLKNSIRELTVRAYLGTPKFEVQSGNVTFRQDLRTFSVQSDTENVKDVKLVGSSTFEYLLEIDEDVLRGSGFAFPEQAATFLGIYPGEEGNFVAGGHNFRIKWNVTALTGPSISSMREFALKHSCQLGNFVVLIFRKNSSEVDFRLNVDSNEWKKARKDTLNYDKNPSQPGGKAQLALDESNGDPSGVFYKEDAVTITLPITQEILDQDTIKFPKECYEFLGLEPGAKTIFCLDDIELNLIWPADLIGDPELDGINYVAQEMLCGLGSKLALTFTKGQVEIEAKDVVVT